MQVRPHRTVTEGLFSPSTLRWQKLRRLAAGLLWVGVLGAPVSSSVRGQAAPRIFARDPEFRGDRVLVKPKPGFEQTVAHFFPGTVVLRHFGNVGNLQLVQLPPGETVLASISQYLHSGLVEYAEPDYRVQALLTPNDPRYGDGSLWGLNNFGQFGGTPGADIKAALAWDLQATAPGLLVAVIDTGIRYTHEDLKANMWVNPTDGSPGTNTVAGNNDPNDDYGHGTEIAGIIGAVGNNSIGVVGVAWQVPLMACKFLNNLGAGTISDAILCIDYARAHGARVICASWGSPNFASAALHDAIASARDAGIIFVAAAGNSGNDNDTTPVYPAGYRDLDNVLSVTATTRNDLLADFANYGAQTVDLAAPGAAIWSTGNGSDSDYTEADGSSYAAAYVAGACALVWAHYPNDAYRQIMDRLLANTDPLPSLAGKCITGGRLNLYSAVGALNSTPPAAPIANFTAGPTVGEIPLTVQFTDTSSGTITAWDWDFGDGSAHSSVPNPQHVYEDAGLFTSTLSVSGAGSVSSKNIAILALKPAPGHRNGQYNRRAHAERHVLHRSDQR